MITLTMSVASTLVPTIFILISSSCCMTMSYNGRENRNLCLIGIRKHANITKKQSSKIYSAISWHMHTCKHKLPFLKDLPFTSQEIRPQFWRDYAAHKYMFLVPWINGQKISPWNQCTFGTSQKLEWVNIGFQRGMKMQGQYSIFHGQAEWLQEVDSVPGIIKEEGTSSDCGALARRNWIFPFSQDGDFSTCDFPKNLKDSGRSISCGRGSVVQS